MKRLLTSGLVLVSLTLGTRAEPTLVNGVAVIVDETVITYKDVFTEMADDEAFLERRYALQPAVLEQKRRELMQERIEYLVEQQLILHEFKRAGYNLPESVIDQRINKDIRNKYGNRLTLTRTLQARGLTFETYRAKLREGEIVTAMAEHFVPHDPVISPHRIDAYYLENREQFNMADQVKLRMIVLTNRAGDSAYSPRKLADEILAKLDEGAPFSEMAKIYSQGSQGATGGDWGWADKKLLRAELADKAFALKNGERSGVVETPDGCYIMLVEETRPSHIRPLSEVRDDIENTLKSEDIKRLHKQWIKRLKNKSFVRYFQ